MAQDLKRVYYHIIDDVVAKMKPEFVQEGVDESVLNAIRQRWAQKLTERGIISEADGQEEAAKKEEDDKAAPSRKRPHDGSGPATKQEANFDTNQPVQPASAQQGMLRQPQQQAHSVPAGLPPQLLQGLQQQQQQQQQQHAGGIQQAAAGLAQVLAQAQNIPGGLQAAIGALPRLQQQAGLQALVQQRGVQLQGLPQQQQQLQGLQTLQNLQAAMQLQGMPRMPGAVQVPGVAGMPGLPAMGAVAGMHQMQIPPQQHAVQQQQQMPRMQMMAGVPRMQGMVQQQHQQQQQQPRPGGYIPQQDGSSDMPPSIAEMAQAAGMSQGELRALMPKRIVAALDACSRAGSSSSSSKMQATQAAATSVGLERCSRGRAVKVVAASRHVKLQRRVPQVDGTGDDEEDEEDYVGDGVEDDGVEEGADDAEDGEEPVEEEDDSDDAEDIAKLDDDLDAQEEADKEDIDNVGFALYEKVHRAKNRWRCNLRYGVFFINGKEYMFNKGNTDLTF